MNESPDSNRASTVSKSQTALLIVWGAMLMGEFTFLMVILRFHLAKPHDHPPESQNIMAWVCFAMCAIYIPAAFFIRSLIFRKSERKSGKISSGAYSAGSIVLWASCDGVAFFAMVVAMQSGTFWPTGVCLGIAVAVQILTSPLGKQFEPQSTL